MTASFGYGQQTPYDRTSPLAEIQFIFRQLIARLNTMKVVKVVAVHNIGGVAPTGTVDVQPLVQQVDGNNNAFSHGVVPGIQYFRLQGGSNAIICDPAVGDVGYVVCSDRDATNVGVGQSNPVTPGSYRRFDLADGVYIGGILNKTPKQYIQFTQTGITIVDMNGNKITTSSTGVTIADVNGNEMITGVGFVNFVTTALQVNGVLITVP